MITNEQTTSARRKIQQTLDLGVQANTVTKLEMQPMTKENSEDFLRAYHRNVNGIHSGGREGVEDIIIHIQDLKVSVHTIGETNVQWIPR